MKDRKMLGSLLVFVGSILCFFLPFVSVSCQGQKLFSISGQQLATGSSVTLPSMSGASTHERVAIEPFTAIAWGSAFIGVGLCLAGRRLGAGSAGAVGVVSLLIMRSVLPDKIQQQTHGMGTASFETGYLLALLLMAAGAAWSGFLYIAGQEDCCRSSGRAEAVKRVFELIAPSVISCSYFENAFWAVD
jgi:hypothetical protein